MSPGKRILLAGVTLFFLARSAAADSTRACVPVATDRIRGADLIAAGIAADPSLDLGPAPLPGLVRTIRADQPFGGICFEVRTTPVTLKAIHAAIHKALDRTTNSATGRDARIEIVEFSQVATPNATLEFSLSSLSYPPAANPDAPVLWRGRAVATNGHSQPIWARVKIAVESPYLEATHEISAGSILTESDITQKSAWSFPASHASISNPADAIGLAAVRRIASGARIDRRALTPPTLVTAGQIIEICVISSAAQLRTTAIAERAGKLGETILARNDQSGKRFRATITGPGQAIVVVAERI